VQERGFAITAAKDAGRLAAHLVESERRNPTFREPFGPVGVAYDYYQRARRIVNRTPHRLCDVRAVLLRHHAGFQVRPDSAALIVD
jgi:hypothetical protein